MGRSRRCEAVRSNGEKSSRRSLLGIVSMLPTVPLLRQGEVYRSLDVQDICPVQGGDPVARITMANSGLIKRDLLNLSAGRKALQRFTTQDLLDITLKAGDIFLNDELPVGDEGILQGPDEYLYSLAATSGLPHSLIRMNMERLHGVFSQVPTILMGLSRGMSTDVLDTAYGNQSGVTVSFVPTTTALGVVLPSNSPAVNALWIPAIAMKTPVALKPGREEPWTPWRVIQSFIKAGAPAEAFSFYPAHHDGSSAIIRNCNRVMLFGGDDTVKQYENDPRVEVHGAGRSKILIGDDEIENWKDHLDLMVRSISANSGRSCINASCVIVPKYANEIADALAEALVPMRVRAQDDPEATLSGFANPKMAEWINGSIQDGLDEGGATDVSLEKRGGSDRYVQKDGMHYMLPTIVRCDSIEHSIGNTEFLFPYASVVEMPQDQMLGSIGKSLAVAAITKDEAWLNELIFADHIERLNVGAMPTNHIEWDQPHEGNLFEFLYRRRSIQVA
ncbi:MAG: aldehyde dehydrogenase family protein [Verrucomicrobiota bacterium]|nr:aldehyde dehydrogenase family protein [Verrucomicrobiota bacterium]